MAKTMKVGKMYHHFEEVSKVYNSVRTTDPEPVKFISNYLGTNSRIEGADIGCGSGRYDLLLLKQIKKLHLICSDINQAMVDETARYLKKNAAKNFTTQVCDATELKFPVESLDCLFNFNTIHHLDPVKFLCQAVLVLRPGGHLFIYTRLKSQNMHSIWGRYFPGFYKRETRLYDLGQIKRWSDKVGSIHLHTIRLFQFPRTEKLARLLEQVKNKHYSTFSLYSEDELERAVKLFKKNVRSEIDDHGNICWTDENVMLVFRRDRI
jgi:SAM-dependent methyltransferase